MVQYLSSINYLQLPVELLEHLLSKEQAYEVFKHCVTKLILDDWDNKSKLLIKL